MPSAPSTPTRKLTYSTATASRASRRCSPSTALLRRARQNARNAATIDSSLRIFTAFLDQDRAGIDVTVAQLTPGRVQPLPGMAAEAPRMGHRVARQALRSSVGGVSGEAIQRNLDDVRAALNHAAGMGRIPIAPKVRSVASGLRSPARSAKFTIEQLGAVVAYAAYDIEALRWVLGMIATGCRPDAVLRGTCQAMGRARAQLRHEARAGLAAHEEAQRGRADHP
jgi:hypothetical protein